MSKFDPFPHTTDLKQTNLKISWTEHGLFYINDGITTELSFKIVSNGEIFSQCFQMSSAAEAS